MVTQSTYLWKGYYPPTGIEPTPGLQVHATPCLPLHCISERNLHKNIFTERKLKVTAAIECGWCCRIQALEEANLLDHLFV